MQIFWCRTEPWLARPAVARYFCTQLGISTGDFFSCGDLVPHAAGRYLLLQGFRQYRPGRRLPPLAHSPCGRPYFPGNQPIFSISHAGKIAVCAFSRLETGADVEEIAPVGAPLLQLLRPEELAYLWQFPAGCQAAVFYQLWTQKESLVKARGGVLADVLEQESLISPEGRWKDRLDGFLLRRVPFPDPAYALSVSTRDGSPPVLTRLELPDRIDQLPEPRHLDRG